MGDAQIDLILRMQDQATAPLRAALAQMQEQLAALKARLKEATGGFHDMAVATDEAGGQLEAIAGRIGRSIAAFAAITLAMAAAEGIKKFVRGIIDASAEAEMLKLRLEVLMGDKGGAQALYKDLQDYADRTIFTLQQVGEGAARLSTVFGGNAQEIQKWTKLAGDLTAALGNTIPFEDVAGQLQKMLSAGAASAEQFRHRGVLAFLGFQEGVHYSVEQTREMLLKAWEDPQTRFGQAVERMAGTWQGLTSTMADAWAKVQREIGGQTGLFDALKGSLKDFLEFFNAELKNGTIQAWAKGVGESIAVVAKNIINMTQALLVNEIMRDKFNAATAWTEKGREHYAAAQAFNERLVWSLEVSAARMDTIEQLRARIQKWAETGTDSLFLNNENTRAASERALAEMRKILAEKEKGPEPAGTPGKGFAGIGAAPDDTARQARQDLEQKRLQMQLKAAEQFTKQWLEEENAAYAAGERTLEEHQQTRHQILVEGFANSLKALEAEAARAAEAYHGQTKDEAERLKLRGEMEQAQAAVRAKISERDHAYAMEGIKDEQEWFALSQKVFDYQRKYAAAVGDPHDASEAAAEKEVEAFQRLAIAADVAFEEIDKISEALRNGEAWKRQRDYAEKYAEALGKVAQGESEWQQALDKRREYEREQAQKGYETLRTSANSGDPLALQGAGALNAWSSGADAEEYERKKTQLHEAIKAVEQDQTNSQQTILEAQKNFVEAMKLLDNKLVDSRVRAMQAIAAVTSDVAGAAANALLAMYERSAGHGKKYWEWYKEFSKVKVAADTAQAIMGIWASATATGPWGIAFAIAESAVAVAAGATQLANINSQNPPTAMAAGGVFERPTFLVGEAGKEAFVPLDRYTVMPKNGGQPSIVVTQNLTVGPGADASLVPVVAAVARSAAKSAVAEYAASPSFRRTVRATARYS